MIFALLLATQGIEKDNLQIQKSIKFQPASYTVADSDQNGVIHVQGDNLVLDFSEVELIGSSDDLPADQYEGIGLVAENCKNLTIQGLRVRGFKVGIKLKNCDGLKLLNCDVSKNYRQHLKSTPRAEDLSDWLFGHENDKNEWLRYGSGIYVEDSKGITVSGCRARNGQNGLCLVRVNDSWIYDNDMSFMSGWGLAMWRASRNEVSNNKFDWCMRGFSFNVYHRGQDSAGIFVFEQCSDNVFAYNSATHGGDGFFLYAGNETLERTGEGGCNRNLLYRNDFSHAAANGIEATFSDGNQFIENILEECDHGIWAGYSYNTKIVGNRISNNNNGISIEHGHGNLIQENRFEHNNTGVNLWANPDSDFQKKPYGKKQDTSSRGYWIVKNDFSGGGVAISLRDTTDVVLHENRFDASMALGLKIAGKVSQIRASKFDAKIEGPKPEALVDLGFPNFKPTTPKTRGTQNAFLLKDALRGRRYIFVDDWGPYDFSKPRIFPARATAWRTAEFFLIGPPGEFEIQDLQGHVSLTPGSGPLPATLKVRTDGGSFRPFSFSVGVGKETLTASGVLLNTSWDVRFFKWDSDPRKDAEAWKKLMGSEPVEKRTLDEINFVWAGGSPGEKLTAEHFGVSATTEMELPEGDYELRSVSDDGVRVWVDEKLIIDNWTWHGPTEDKSKVKLHAGKHSFRIEYFELDGYAQLQFWIEPAN